ncbi:MAG: tetratricopeptide repeat protein [Candidatus Sulfotelmatobacter sp.]|jgi:tetratricopeptide (TPR) repeat protein
MRCARLLLLLLACTLAAALDPTGHSVGDQTDLNATVQKILQQCDALLQGHHFAEAAAGYTEVLAFSNADPKLLNAARLGLAQAQIGKAAADAAVTPTPMPPGDLNKAVQAILTDADTAFQEKRYADAIAGYTEALASSGADPKLLNQARLSKAKAALAKAATENPTGAAAVWHSVATGWNASLTAFGTILFWIVVLFVVLFIRYLLPAGNALLINLQDVSATDRDNASALLSREFQYLLSPPQSGGGEMIFESMTDFEGGSLASIKPMVQMPGLDPSMLATNAVTLGPLQVTPASLLAFGRSLRAPRYKQILSGTLLQQSPRTVLTAQILSKHGSSSGNTGWHAVDDSPDARRTVLRRIAAGVAIALADGTGVTQVPQSLECTLEGIDRLKASGAVTPSVDALKAARNAFQSAVAHDPENWLALSNLTVLERQLGDYDTAIQHCLALESILQRQPRSRSLSNFLESHPTFAGSIRYNHALALAKQDDWHCNKEAIRLLEEIIAEGNPVLMPLATSARAAALLFQFERFRESGAAAREREVREEVERCVKELNALAEAGNTRVLAVARAVALNAYGYIVENTGDYRHAREQFEAAVAQDPSFVAPHINLGRLYRHAGSTVTADWLVKAKAHLKQALDLQPDNRQANYEMGRLHAHVAVREFPDALKSFAAAQPHSNAAYQASEIYCDSGLIEFDLDKGIEQLRISVNLARTVDFRMQALVRRLLDAAEAQIVQAGAAEQASPGESLDKRKFCARARNLLFEVERDLSALPTTTAAEQRTIASSSARCAGVRKRCEAVCGQRPPAGPSAPAGAPENVPPAS